MKNQHFNLIDEPWIPVANAGPVSLKQIFSEPSLEVLGGNPVQKIAVIKLLLAIAQSAFTPQGEEEWSEMGAQGMADRCLDYLDKWHDRFWLYGDKPFLQMPKIALAEKKPWGATLPEVSSGNTTVLIQTQVENDLSDAERAMLVLVQMGFALSGKKTDNSVVLTPGYLGKSNPKGNSSSAKTGSSLGFYGYMHSFLQADNLSTSIWLNLLTAENIQDLAVFPNGLGVAPWQNMPDGEADTVAEALKQSYMGRLIPLGRFCLLDPPGLHYSEGIEHADYKAGVSDPSTAVNFVSKKPKALWINPEKRPWRELTALLGFFEKNTKGGFNCLQIKLCLDRARTQVPVIGVWSGGLRVSNKAGEQYASGTDDFVESSIFLKSIWLGEAWYDRLKSEMSALEEVAKNIYGATARYFGSQMMEGENYAKQTTHLFWQLCERRFQDLVDHCGDPEELPAFRKTFAGFANKAYNHFCPQNTARQLDAWAKNRPNLSKFLKDNRGERA